MKKLLLGLLAVAALATATAASATACYGHHHDSARFRTTAFARYARGGVFEQLAGTGSGFHTGSANASGAIAGHPLGGGSFGASLSPDWSKAFANWHGGSCAPTAGTLSLTGSDSNNTLASSVHGLTCTVEANPRNVAAVFFGRAKVTNGTGTLSNVNGYGRVLLVEKTDGTVKGFAFAGFAPRTEQRLAAFARYDARDCGGR
jgi:cyclic lactone autoinducer peptide